MKIFYSIIFAYINSNCLSNSTNSIFFIDFCTTEMLRFSALICDQKCLIWLPTSKDTNQFCYWDFNENLLLLYVLIVFPYCFASSFAIKTLYICLCRGINIKNSDWLCITACDIIWVWSLFCFAKIFNSFICLLTSILDPTMASMHD